ncbi:hypothetical protein SSABA_v1c08140 [Spiroplasma sabaudiense Ar-1343]|uniref:Transmembrane protein n=1 Tax=Spiroplasma sabaudiense Ar-1343 TaxID=1276257 RepID=W6AAN7_9MOLU|nr:hypothetical protein [Spiroplasma sabaudiense]AHI54213.1 hypothetical protein SSABA_v1c08140 [Spiroplasma sabaudiense Ar-1343]
MENNALGNNLKNPHCFKVIFLVTFFMIVIAVPSFIFIFITHTNANLLIYLEKYNTLKPILSSELNNPKLIYFVQWTAFSFFALAIMMVIFFGLILRNSRINFNVKAAYISVILFFLILFIILITFAQNEYATFQLFFKYQNLTNHYNNYEDTENLEAWRAMIEIKTQFTINYSNKIIFNWLTNKDVWWMLFAQSVVVIISFISLQDLLFGKKYNDNNIQKIIETNLKKSQFGESFLKKIYNRLFVVSEKNVSILMIVFSTILILPQVIYAISISTTSGRISNFANWNYLVPKIVTDDENFNNFIDHANQIPSSYFVLIQLPIIAVGLTMATMIIFISVYIRNEDTSNNIYLIQFAIFIAELFFTIIAATYSKITLNNLVKIWNQDLGIRQSFLELCQKFLNSENGQGDAGIFYQNFFAISLGPHSIFKINFIDFSNTNSTIKSLWLERNEFIAETIISLSFAITTTAITGHKVYLIRNEKKSLRPKKT